MLKANQMGEQSNQCGDENWFRYNPHQYNMLCVDRLHISKVWDTRGRSYNNDSFRLPISCIAPLRLQSVARFTCKFVKISGRVPPAVPSQVVVCARWAKTVNCSDIIEPIGTGLAFCGRTIRMHLPFLSFLHTDMTQVIEIFPCGRK